MNPGKQLWFARAISFALCVGLMGLPTQARANNCAGIFNPQSPTFAELLQSFHTKRTVRAFLQALEGKLKTLEGAQEVSSSLGAVIRSGAFRGASFDPFLMDPTVLVSGLLGNGALKSQTILSVMVLGQLSRSEMDGAPSLTARLSRSLLIDVQRALLASTALDPQRLELDMALRNLFVLLGPEQMSWDGNESKAWRFELSEAHCEKSDLDALAWARPSQGEKRATLVNLYLHVGMGTYLDFPQFFEFRPRAALHSMIFVKTSHSSPLASVVRMIRLASDAQDIYVRKYAKDWMQGFWTAYKEARATLKIPEEEYQWLESILTFYHYLNASPEFRPEASGN